MAKNKGREQEEPRQEAPRYRPFWSGVITFGLVSVPVGLFPANRPKPVSLKIVDAEGTPLQRRYYCTKEEEALERNDLVRGYEVEKGRFIVIEDEELEAAAPEKSREIDLRRFVDLSELNPVYFERAYFLAPESEVTKAYRLLARSMEEQKKAGIATFVMRDREYIIAIMAEKGILRAETLRFAEELRSPEDVGLPKWQKPKRQDVRKMQKAMKARFRKTLKEEALEDETTQALRKKINQKLRKGKDVIELPEEQAGAYEEESNVVDLMQVLKERLERGGPIKEGEQPDSGGGKAKRKSSARKRSQSDKSQSGEDLYALSKDELYRRAREKNIAGRSFMSKRELAEALKEAQ